MSRVGPSGQPGSPPVLPDKHFNVERYSQTVLPNVSISAMYVGTIHFYHFTPLSLTLTLPGGNMVSAKQKPFASFSPTPFGSSRTNLLW